MTLIGIIGWLGTILIVSAYFLNISKRLSQESKTYLLINILGSTLLATSLITKQSWDGVALQAVWILISMYGIYRSYMK